MQPGGTEKDTHISATNELGDIAQMREDMQAILPPAPECALTEDEVRDEHALKKIEPNKSLELFLSDPNLPKTTARIDTRMIVEIRVAMQQLLMEHRDVFTSHEDMPGINPMIMQHHLSVDPRASGVR